MNTDTCSAETVAIAFADLADALARARRVVPLDVRATFSTGTLGVYSAMSLVTDVLGIETTR